MGVTGLVVAALVLMAAMAGLVPLLTGVWPGGLTGYFAALALYWVFFCVPVGLAVLGREGLARKLTLRVWGAWWLPVLILAQPLGLFLFYALPEGLLGVPTSALLLGLAFALVNAPLEEIAWRGAYLEASRGNVLVQQLGVVLFALWHVPLTLAVGVTFGVGPVALVASSFALGALWAVAAWWTRAIGWPVVGHVLTNAAVFPLLIAGNM